MKRIKSLVCAVLVCALLLSSGLKVRAAETIQTGATTSLTINYVYANEGISGCTFKVYKVATMNADASFTLTGDFAGMPVDLEKDPEDGWDSLAATLKTMADVEGFSPAGTVKTDAEGKAELTGLEVGLYLVVGDKCVNDGYTYRSLPVLVTLPSLNSDDVWFYDVIMSPKVERTPVSEEQESISRRVMKVWVGSGNIERPAQVEVSLLRDGVIVDTVTLNAANNWRFDWTDLDRYDENGSEIEWTVTEKRIQGYTYTVRIMQQGTTFMVVNNLTGVEGEHEPPNDPPLPNTGLLWWPVAALSCAGIVCLIIGIKRRKSE